MGKGKLTKEEREQIKQLWAEGMNRYDLAEKFNVSVSTIQYWIKAESRKRRIDYGIEYYRKKTPEEKKLVYNKHKTYFANYFKERYHNDPIFREKHKERCRRTQNDNN